MLNWNPIVNLKCSVVAELSAHDVTVSAIPLPVTHRAPDPRVEYFHATLVRGSSPNQPHGARLECCYGNEYILNTLMRFFDLS